MLTIYRLYGYKGGPSQHSINCPHNVTRMWSVAAESTLHAQQLANGNEWSRGFGSAGVLEVWHKGEWQDGRTKYLQPKHYHAQPYKAEPWQASDYGEADREYLLRYEAKA